MDISYQFLRYPNKLVVLIVITVVGTKNLLNKEFVVVSQLISFFKYLELIMFFVIRFPFLRWFVADFYNSMVARKD